VSFYKCLSCFFCHTFLLSLLITNPTSSNFMSCVILVFCKSILWYNLTMICLFLPKLRKSKTWTWLLLQSQATNIRMWFQQLQQRFHSKVSQVVVFHVFLKLWQTVSQVIFTLHHRRDNLLSTDDTATIVHSSFINTLIISVQLHYCNCLNYPLQETSASSAS